jgi:hypothetical protein
MGVLRELLVPALFGVFWVVFYFETADMPKESILFPHILMGVMSVLAVLVIFVEVRRSKARTTVANAPDDDEAQSHFLAGQGKPALMVGLTAGYLVLFMVTNFLISTTVFLAGSMVVFRVHWLKAAIIGLCFSFALYAIFHLGFKIRL